MTSELSHYSSATFDVDYLYPFGSRELGGNANRSQYDLKQHEKESGKDLSFFDEDKKEKVIPRVIEPTFGMERTFLAIICEAYEFDKKRENVVLHLHPKLAPIKVAVFPLMKKDGLDEAAKKLHLELKQDFNSYYDYSGSIGRRYARQDEIGTPYCITVDYDSLKNKDVTIRDRDSTEQKRIKVSEVKEILRKLLNQEIEFKSLK